MQIISPSFQILNPKNRDEGIEMLRTIESIARVSHRAEDRQTPDSWERFIGHVVVSKGDWSVVEHVTAAVKIKVDRGVSHEWVRHRIGSITQESTRFVRYGGDAIEFVEPEWPEGMNIEAKYQWRATLSEIETAYLYMLRNGAPPQIARSILPNALATTLVATYNLRTWRHLFQMRTSKETHPDYRRVMIPLLSAFKERIPLLYDDLEPNLKQSVSIGRAR